LENHLVEDYREEQKKDRMEKLASWVLIPKTPQTGRKRKVFKFKEIRVITVVR